MIRTLLSALVLDALFVSMAHSAPPAGSPISLFEIKIRERAFTPGTVTIPPNTPIRLAIVNEDNDLHAFVPLLLFQGTNVQVTGNAAPEFNETGFARVLIPPQGRVELTFASKTSGSYFYICDLPGHQMRGEIIVAGTAPEQTTR